VSLTLMSYIYIYIYIYIYSLSYVNFVAPSNGGFALDALLVRQLYRRVTAILSRLTLREGLSFRYEQGENVT